LTDTGATLRTDTQSGSAFVGSIHALTAGTDVAHCGTPALDALSTAVDHANTNGGIIAVYLTDPQPKLSVGSGTVQQLLTRALEKHVQINFVLTQQYACDASPSADLVRLAEYTLGQVFTTRKTFVDKVRIMSYPHVCPCVSVHRILLAHRVHNINGERLSCRRLSTTTTDRVSR
jgi:hypothetical protein